MFKRFRFWFTLFSLLVVLNNLIGEDDKNLLLFFTSPPFWVTEFYAIQISMTGLYILNVAFCFLFGWAMDYGVSKWKNSRS